MTYVKYGVQLNDEQRRNLVHAGTNKTGLNIRLSHDKLVGSDELNLTHTQIDKIKKCIEIDIGMTLKLSKSQVQSMNKSGGFIPLLLAGLGAIASLAGGASAIAKTVIDKRARDRELDEQQRHNMAMEHSGAGLRCDACKGTGFVGSGVFLNPNTEGSGLYLSPATNQCTPFLEQ